MTTTDAVQRDLMLPGDRHFWSPQDRVPKGIEATQDVLAARGLDFEVERRRVFVGEQNLDAEGYDAWMDAEAPAGQDGFVAIVRQDTDAVLGITTPKYRPVQNEHAFDVISSLVQVGEARWEAAGSLRGGARCWGVLKLNRHLTVAGDAMDPFIALSVDHSGRGAVSAVFWPMRVACTNMLDMALKRTTQAVSIRHVGHVEDRLAEAAKVMQRADTYMGQLAKLGGHLSTKRVGLHELDRWMARLYPDGTGDKAGADQSEKREAVMHVLENSPNLADHRGTAWGFVNAVAEYQDHLRPRRATGDRMHQLLEGTDRAPKTRALDIALSAFSPN